MNLPTQKQWICLICGYEHIGEAPPDVCPVCGAGAEEFELQVVKEINIQTISEKRWICTVCGYVHEGEEPPKICPTCGADAEEFTPDKIDNSDEQNQDNLDTYLRNWEKKEDPFDPKYARITQLAKTGKSEISAMGTTKAFPGWDLILFKGAQLSRLPLNENEDVCVKTVIGASAKQPLKINMPFYVSHMSFGALSREAKIALAKGSTIVGTAMCSGEGGMLKDERAAAKHYIYELGTAAFSHLEESIKLADAVEIKIGQAAKPGMGGHLPKEKITDEIATIRGISKDTDSISPGRPFNISSPEDLCKQVEKLKNITGGVPIGVKITAGRIEEDLKIILEAQPDFITIDCRGGATGAAPTYIKDNVCLPPIFAISRARKFLDANNSKITLCVTGGFRDAADIAKGLALGADAVALATASLIAIGCQQYRICNTGKCPVGITTQDPELRTRLMMEYSVNRFVNFYQATLDEMKTIARINGLDDIRKLSLEDVFTISNEISQNTDIKHA